MNSNGGGSGAYIQTIMTLAAGTYTGTVGAYSLGSEVSYSAGQQSPSGGQTSFNGCIAYGGLGAYTYNLNGVETAGGPGGAYIAQGSVVQALTGNPGSHTVIDDSWDYITAGVGGDSVYNGHGKGSGATSQIVGIPGTNGYLNITAV